MEEKSGLGTAEKEKLNHKTSGKRRKKFKKKKG